MKGLEYAFWSMLIGVPIIVGTTAVWLYKKTTD
jgi:hypothetical protein